MIKEVLNKEIILEEKTIKNVNTKYLDTNKEYKLDGVSYSVTRVTQSGAKGSVLYWVSVSDFCDDKPETLDATTLCCIELDDKGDANIYVHRWSDRAKLIDHVRDIIVEGDDVVGVISEDISQRSSYPRVKYLLGLSESKCRTAMGKLDGNTAYEALLSDKCISKLCDNMIADYGEKITKRLSDVAEYIVRLNK